VPIVEGFVADAGTGTACVELPAGSYRLGEPGEERSVTLDHLLIGRWPVTNHDARKFFGATGRRHAASLAARLEAPELADHPVTDVSFDDAVAFCDWAAGELGRPVRLPTGDDWEAAARGHDGRPWPWGHTFDAERCACAESGWGWTVPVTAHPAGAGPFGAEQLAGNVWEWVSDRTPDGWRIVRGGSWLDHAWGLRASRALPADPRRGTPTTGFRIVIDPRREQ
jgi:formylglycine-generating enzyme required for sulfatase activity